LWLETLLWQAGKRGAANFIFVWFMLIFYFIHRPGDRQPTLRYKHGETRANGVLQKFGINQKLRILVF